MSKLTRAELRRMLEYLEKGGHIVVRVNGKKTAELLDDPDRKEGRFALQVHGAQDVDVWFKDIELKAP